MYEQNVLSGHNKVIQAHVQSRATGIEDKGHHVLRAVVGARPGFRIAHHARLVADKLANGKEPKEARQGCAIAIAILGHRPKIQCRDETRDAMNIHS